MPTLNSSMLSECEYDEAEKLLRIKFTKGGWYGYLDVPKTVYEELLSADSAGKYFLSSIKNKYEVEKY